MWAGLELGAGLYIGGGGVRAGSGDRGLYIRRRGEVGAGCGVIYRRGWSWRGGVGGWGWRGDNTYGSLPISVKLYSDPVL